MVIVSPQLTAMQGNEFTTIKLSHCPSLPLTPENHKMNVHKPLSAVSAILFATLVMALPTTAAAQEVVRDGLASPTVDTSLLGLFMDASIVVQIVMIGLLLASVWCWAIIVDKVLLFARTKRQLNQFEQVFWSGQSLEELYRSLSERRNSGMASLFVAAMGEWKRSFERNARSPIGLQTRIDKVLDVAMAREMERLEKRLLFLATLGSAAPFIGLFGTVIGIMTSFQAIAGSKSTNLAVVAPGIAEALLATALGLLAAIPAVVAYNKFSADSGKIATRLEGFADEFSAILSRQIDEKTAA
jgi:biopolymer transport protein TolQ